MPAYATPTEILAWLPVDVSPSGDLGRLADRASELVDAHVRAEYSIDAAGAPTDATVAQVLADAVCAQIEQWIEVSEENSIDGLAGTQISVDGYSGGRAPDLAPRARHLLKTYGLLSPVALSRGASPLGGVW